MSIIDRLERRIGALKVKTEELKKESARLQETLDHERQVYDLVAQGLRESCFMKIFWSELRKDFMEGK